LKIIAQGFRGAKLLIGESFEIDKGKFANQKKYFNF
jgi:hypothetical protein